MKIQFATTLKNRHGEALMEPDPRRQGQLKPISLGDVCCAVLDAPLQEDQRENVKDKVRRWELIQQITKAEHDLTPLELLDTDLDEIRGRLGKGGFGATVIGNVMRLLDTPALELKEEDGDASKSRQGGSKGRDAQVQARSASQWES